MKKVLCFGDSNTWGYNPATEARYSGDVRWPGVLRGSLGRNYQVIEEGLNGRTTVWDDPIEGYKNGKRYLIPCLETHKPLDLVIIFLGTNDLKKRFSLSAYDIAEGAATLARLVLKSETGRDGQAPEILLLAPPPIGKLSNFARMFEDAAEKSKLLGEEYSRVAEENSLYLLNTSDYIVSSDIDGIHFDEEDHRKLGRAVASYIKEHIFT